MASTLLHTGQRVLGSRYAGWLLVFLALTARILQLVFFYNIRVDASFQVLATRHFVEGRGISLASVDPADLAHTIYQPLINWPPGYSLLLAPFYLLFGKDYIAAGITLDILCAMLLIFACRKILRELQVPAYAVNGFTFLTGFFIYYFYFIASSDAIAISLFLVAIALLLRTWRRNRFTLGNIIAIALLLTLVAWIKYLFIPAVFLLPLFLLFLGYRFREADRIRAGWIMGLLMLAGVGALLLYQRQVSGTAGYISQAQRGFFPEHLLDFYPFLPASFLQLQTVSAITGLPSETGTPVYRIFQALHLAMLLAWIVLLFRAGKRLIERPEQKFELLAFLLGMAVTALLLLLSVRVAREEIVPGQFWTYAEEARYYGLCFVLVQLLLILSLTRKTSLLFGRKTGFILLFLLLVESTRGLVFTANRIRYFGKETYSWQQEKAFQQYAASLLPARGQGEAWILAGSTYYMNHRVSLQTGLPVLYESTVLNGKDWPSSQPVAMMVIIRDADRERFRSFLERYANKLRGRWADYSFYLVVQR